MRYCTLEKGQVILPEKTGTLNVQVVLTYLNLP